MILFISRDAFSTIVSQKCVVLLSLGYHTSIARYVVNLGGHNRQSPIASVQSTRSTLAGHSAVPCGTNVKRMNTNRAIRIAAQRPQARVCRKAFQPEFGAHRGLARVLKSPSNPQNCRKKEKIPEKGTFIFCAKPWYAPNPGSKEI